MEFASATARNTAMTTMQKRILFGAILIAGVGGLATLDAALADVEPPHPLLAMAGLFALLGVGGVLEMSRLARSAGVRLLTASALLGTLGLTLMPWWLPMAMKTLPPGSLIAAAAMGAVAAVFLEQMLRFRLDNALSQLSATLLTVVYLGGGAAAALLLRSAYGLWGLVLFLLAVKITDIGAYFVGSAAGRHKMIPWLSPGKSWEGLAGGLAAAAGASAMASWLLKICGADVGLSPGAGAVFGLVVGGCGQFGDLCESLLKRSAAVKDSGALVPEFGGVLDIVDSPLMAAPAGLVMFGLLGA
jgi:phosphatidate cytidylyltransferase